MAGIRPQRGNGFSGIHIAFVVAIVLCVVSWVALGILYTAQAKLDQDREAAIKDRDALASSGEMMRFKTQFAKPGQTVLGGLAEERSIMAKAIDGQPDHAASVVQREVASRYEAIKKAGKIDPATANLFVPEFPLLDAVNNLYSGLTSEIDRRVKAETSLQSTQEQLAETSDKLKKAQDLFDQTMADTSTKLQETQARLDKYQKDNTQVIETLKTDRTRAEDLLRKQTERNREEMAEQAKDLGKMQARLNDALTTLKQVRGQPDVLAVARTADGKVIRALPNDPFVYINLGAKDHLTLGMTFTVYGGREAIPATGEGKATVEITTIYDDIAAARIISRHGDVPVMQGDLVANVIYSKDRKNRVVVLGRFDLDNTGTATAEGADRVKAMIQEWGGEVVGTIDTTTDFVVIGQGPGQPIPPSATASPIDKQRYQERVQENEAFQNVVNEAKSLMVPILNQTQFLHFVGYNLNALRSGAARAEARASAY